MPLSSHTESLKINHHKVKIPLTVVHWHYLLHVSVMSLFNGCTSYFSQIGLNTLHNTQINIISDRSETRTLKTLKIVKVCDFADRQLCNEPCKYLFVLFCITLSFKYVDNCDNGLGFMNTTRHETISPLDDQ